MPTSICQMETQSGEHIALSCVEINLIPSYNLLLNEYPSNTDIDNEYRKAFGNLLNEIFINYKAMKESGLITDLSCEFVWVTEPVSNQKYKAKIRLFLVIRTIDRCVENTEIALRRIQNSCLAMLRLYKYGVDENYDEIAFRKVLDCVNKNTARCVFKTESNEQFQNQIMPSCYSFDIFNAYAKDMGGLISSLIDQPNCMLSVQVIPSEYTSTEESAILQFSHSLDMLNQGVISPGIGNVAFHSMSRLADVYRYYQENRNNSLFLFNIMIVGDEASVDDIMAKTKGYISFDITKKVRLEDMIIPNASGMIDNIYSYPWIVNEIQLSNTRKAYQFGFSEIYQSMHRLAFVVTVEELSGLFSLPVGNKRIQAGLPINDSDNMNKNYGEGLIDAGDMSIGELKSGSGKHSIGISLKDITKHMLVVGTPGSGKTTFSIGLLDRLWKEQHIPFLVIEPAKNEYRALIQSIPDIQVFTPGKNFISPFMFNPFIPPRNVKLETYKSTLKTAFEAGVSMTTPLDKIFEESINNCYSDFRWIDSYTVDDNGIKFNISDFIKCFQRTFDEIGYTGDANNIGKAGVVRLKGLTKLFDNYNSIPIEDILNKPTIIELAAIENSDEKALIISLLLLSILAYVNSNYIGDGLLKNVILLEEAHVLLDADTNVGVGDANPSRIAQGLVKRMLAEIRSYGVGVMIADQSPRKVTLDVIALTDIKVVFRIVETTDRKIISESMNMSDGQTQRLSRLKPGEAFLYFNKLDEPEEIITPDYRLDHNIDISISDDAICKQMNYWEDKSEKLRPYPECEMTKCCSCSCDYERRITSREIARRIFVKYFKNDMKDFKTLERVFKRISEIIREESYNTPFTQELLICVKVHLWRKIKYETEIPVREIQIQNSVGKWRDINEL